MNAHQHNYENCLYQSPRVLQTFEYSILNKTYLCTPLLAVAVGVV